MGRATRYASLRKAAAALAAALFVASMPAPVLRAETQAQRPIRAELQVSATDGYARLLFRFAEAIETDVKLAGSVLIISFDRPVDLPLSDVVANAPDYIGAVRRDPNGMALRMALARRVTLNTIPAAEKLFVDLMPDGWAGPPPSLPMDVIQDLAQRARAADRMMAERKAAKPAAVQNVRVHMARQPTFTRYSFDVPDQVSVGTATSEGGFKVTFGAPFAFDFGETRGAAPPYVPLLEQRQEGEETAVQFGFAGAVKVRNFRDDQSYVVDVIPSEAKGESKADNKDGKIEAKSANGKTVELKLSDDAKPEAKMEAKPEAKQDAKPEPKPEPKRADSAHPPAVAAPAVAPPATTPREMASEEKSDRAPERPSDRIAARPSPEAAAPQAEPARPESKPAAAPAAERQTAEKSAEKPAAQAPAEKQDVDKSASASADKPADTPAEKPDAPREARTGDAAAPARADAAPRPVVAELRYRSDGVRLAFPFRDPTPAAMFRRGDYLWLAFDTEADINLTAARGDTSLTMRDPQLLSAPGLRIVRIKLDRTLSAGLSLAGNGWIVQFGAPASDQLSTLGLTRQVTSPASVEIGFEKPAALHRFADPETRDTLLIVTGLGPVRGIPKDHEFIEFRVQSSTHGLVIVPKADDLEVKLSPERVTLMRPGGLTISSGGARQTDGTFRTLLDYKTWLDDRGTKYRDRYIALMNAVASSPPQLRSAARLDLARFFMAKKLYPEAKAVLDTEVAEPKSGAEGASAILLRGIANLFLQRVPEAAKDFSDQFVGAQFDIQLWRGITAATQGRWSDAREVFASVNMSLLPLPPEIQLMALKAMLTVAMESGDTALAAARLNEIDSIRDMPPDPFVGLLRGRLAETLGQTTDARAIYHEAAASDDRALAAHGRLAELLLDLRAPNVDRQEIMAGLETLSAVWRGGEVEVRALRELARLYSDDGRYREAFTAARTALQLRPQSTMTRQLHDEMLKQFDTLFLGGKADTIPVIEALGIFYDFQDLTPVGRRGDEMIRRLADRLVTVDLLDQAGDLLQYQIEQRLQGAAKSQIAIRLATIHLMNRKPEKAVAVLRATRTADLSTELRNQRLLLEARAQSELGRHDLALEIIGNLSGRDALLLRSDILWAARRWREAAETIELVYEPTRADKTPVGDVERADLLRAAIGYTLSNDGIGTLRFTEKFAPRMVQEQDKTAFRIATSPDAAGTAAFRDIAKLVARVDRLSTQMREAPPQPAGGEDERGSDDTPRQQSRRTEPRTTSVE